MTKGQMILAVILVPFIYVAMVEGSNYLVEETVAALYQAGQEEYQEAMLSMVDKYIEDTKDMPVTIRCQKVAKACDYQYLRTGR